MNLLTVNNVYKSFNIESGIFKSAEGKIHALNNISLALDPGEVIGVVGESGSGKTTLGKIISRLYKPDKGEVFIENKNIDSFSRDEFAGKVQMVFQDPFASLNPKLSIGTILKEASQFLKSEKRMEKIMDTLKIAGMQQNIIYDYPHQFSGGQRQRIALARALIREPKIIIADEPLSSLDISTQNQLLNLFLELKQKLSLSMVFISHDLVATSIISDYIIVMKDGKIVEEGKTEKIVSKPKDTYTRKLLNAVPRI